MQDRLFSGARISSVAAVVPKNRIPLVDFADLYGAEEIERITRATGIESVTVADENMTSADYCVEAAKRLFDESGIGASDIDGLIFLSESPDYIIPNTAAVLQERLGISKHSINMDLRYGCAGYIYALFQASMLIETGYCRCVLILAGDTMSKYVNARDRSLRMVLGDAACATFVVKEDDVPSMYSFFVDGSGAGSLLIPAGGCRLPAKHGVTDALVFDDDGNGRTQENLYMNGMDVMVFAVRAVPDLVHSLLTDIGWKKEDVDLFAFHQANKLIVSRIEKVLKLDHDKVPFDITHTGNCGFVSIPLLLCQQYQGIRNDLRNVIICGFGAGLIAAAAAVDFSRTRFVGCYEV